MNATIEQPHGGAQGAHAVKCDGDGSVEEGRAMRMFRSGNRLFVVTARRILVMCLECGKRFSTAKMVPSCPKCGGSDVEPQ